MQCAIMAWTLPLLIGCVVLPVFFVGASFSFLSCSFLFALSQDFGKFPGNCSRFVSSLFECTVPSFCDKVLPYRSPEPIVQFRGRFCLVCSSL